METEQTTRLGTTRRLRPGEPVPTAEPRIYTTSDGYVVYRWKVAPRTYLETLEHRIVDGRVTTAAHVHHINRDRTDNRPANLQHLTASEHQHEHGGDSRQTRGSKLDYAEARRLYLSGKSTIEVAAIIGCTPPTISRHLRDIMRDSGVGRRIVLDNQRIVELYLAGMSPRKIGTIFGVGDGPIRRILKTEGIPPRRPGRPLRSAQYDGE